MRYINYARRSSDEKSKKQVQSIEDQLSDTRRYASEFNLEVVEEMTESKSAKEPGRPVFNSMIEKIRKREADAILCWKLDRLARNPIDAATLRWMMRQGLLLQIRTPYQTYRPEDNAVITAVESAMAEQYIIDLKKGVERGMRSKCEKGGFPFMAPQGYLNDRINQTIKNDPERFHQIQKAWHLLISEQYTARDIHDKLINEWGYRSRPSRVNPSGKLTCSALYKIFRNTFYKGEFRFQGVTYQHAFERMVTPEEWDKAQAILNRRARKGNNRYKHTYSGMITCASCGFSVSPDVSKGHTYYHCANRLGICTKRGVREEQITLHIDTLLESITIEPEFEEFALGVLKELRGKESALEQTANQSNTEMLQKVLKQKDALLSLHLDGHLTQDEYIAKKEEIVQRENNLKLKETAMQSSHSTDDTEAIANVIRYVTKAKSLFQTQDSDVRRVIARNLSTSYVLNNGGELQVELNPLLVPVRTLWKKQWQEYQDSEPSEIGSGKSKKPLSELNFQQWCATFTEYRGLIEQNCLCFSLLWPDSDLDIKRNFVSTNVLAALSNSANFNI